MSGLQSPETPVGLVTVPNHKTTHRISGRYVPKETDALCPGSGGEVKPIFQAKKIYAHCRYRDCDFVGQVKTDVQA